MKKIIYLSLVGCFFATLVWAQEKIEAPILNVGSKWITKAGNGWEMTSEVIGEEEDVYVLSMVVPEGHKKGEWKYFYSKKTMNCVKVLCDEKDNSEARDNLKKFYDFPLYPGKKWTYQYTFFSARHKKDVPVLVELSVLGIEDVEVPAGKFKAFKVKVHYSTIGSAAMGGTAYYWWAPNVKMRVKQEWEPSDFWKNLEYTKLELISFELK